jgi:hypothetical protein
MWGLWEFAGHGPGCTFHDDGHVACVSSGPFAWPNLLFHPRLNGVALESYLSTLFERLRAQACRQTWVRGCDDAPPHLYEQLQEYGFREAGQRPTMVFDLASPLLDAEPAPVPGLEISHLVSSAGLDEWLAIVSASFFGGRGLGRDLFALHLLPSSRIRLFLARIDGQAVGTALLFLHAGVAGLHLVGVPESYRRRGIATRITRHALRESRALGYKAAILKASPLGEGIYRGLGFQYVARLTLYRRT